MRVLTAAGRPENTVVVYLPDKSDEDGDEQTCIHGQFRSRSRRVRRPSVWRNFRVIDKPNDLKQRSLEAMTA